MTGGARIVAILLAATAAVGARGETLFQSDAPLQMTLAGSVRPVADGSRSPRDAAILLPDGSRHPVAISARGITRLKSDVCQFAPMRVDFVQPPPAASPFAGQRRLKLVTHCRSKDSFQKHVLLEYAAYRIYNLMSPHSFRVRLAQIGYAGSDGRPFITRAGFFIEDDGDVGARNGLRPAPVGARVPTSSLDPRTAASVAVFQYLIANLDWSTRAGPEGDRCCHNARLLAPPAGAAPLVPLPYDFDFSGLVDAPYAVPPDGLNVRSVRQRQYRGFCAHNGEAAAIAAQTAARRAEIHALVRAVPGLDPRAAQGAIAFLDKGLDDLADPAGFAREMARTCIR